MLAHLLSQRVCDISYRSFVRPASGSSNPRARARAILSSYSSKAFGIRKFVREQVRKIGRRQALCRDPEEAADHDCHIERWGPDSLSPFH